MPGIAQHDTEPVLNADWQAHVALRLCNRQCTLQQSDFGIERCHSQQRFREYCHRVCGTEAIAMRFRKKKHIDACCQRQPEIAAHRMSAPARYLCADACVVLRLRNSPQWWNFLGRRFARSKQANDLAFVVDIDGVRTRHFRQSRHGHDVAAHQHHELGTCREPYFADRQHMI